jgi:hypothetical protein
MSFIRPGQIVQDYFFLPDAGGQPVTGETDFDVTSNLGGSPIALAVSVTEIDAAARPGEYSVVFTSPSTLGSLFVTIKNDTHAPSGFSAQYFIDPSASGETGNQLVTITVTDGTNPISGVRVSILDSSETFNIFSNLTTNSLGQIQVGIDNGSYKVLLSKQLIQFNATEDLDVSGATTVTYTGTPVSILAPTDDTKTVLSGFIQTLVGDNRPNYEIVFELKGTNLVTEGGIWLDRAPISVLTDDTGMFAVELFRTSTIVPEKSNRAEPRYKMTFPETGDSFLFQLPDEDTVNIADVEFDNDGMNEWEV